jgi:hypothetical protein
MGERCVGAPEITELRQGFYVIEHARPRNLPLRRPLRKDCSVYWHCFSDDWLRRVWGPSRSFSGLRASRYRLLSGPIRMPGEFGPPSDQAGTNQPDRS